MLSNIYEIEGRIILAGDFNIVMDMFMDKSKFSRPITRLLYTCSVKRKGLHRLLPLSEIIF